MGNYYIIINFGQLQLYDKVKSSVQNQTISWENNADF